MALSVVDPVSSAIERAKHVCFRPFDLGKWFVIGFCAFLAGFVEGGASVPTNFNPGFPSGGGGGESGPKPPGDVAREAIDWVQAHLTPILVIAGIVLIVGILLGAVFTWLGSRGQFMFIDNIARNRGAVAAPWREYRKEGNSVFWFHFLFGFASFAAIVAVFAAAILIALPDIRARHFGPSAIMALTVGISSFIIVSLVSALINLFLNDFVVPIMYLRHIGVIAAWSEFRRSMLSGNVGTFTLYVLFKILIAIPYQFLAALLTCCTLCIGAIPYLGTHVLMLPLHVFWKSYPLYFIEQFGPEWRVFSTEDEFAAELVDGDDEWADERFRPEDESDRPPDDRIRPE